MVVVIAMTVMTLCLRGNNSAGEHHDGKDGK
jgi:hypothetical protein